MAQAGQARSGKRLNLPDVHDARWHSRVQHSAGRRLAHRLHAARQESGRVGRDLRNWLSGESWRAAGAAAAQGNRAPRRQAGGLSRRMRRRRQRVGHEAGAPDGRHKGCTHNRNAAEALGGQHAQRLQCVVTGSGGMAGWPPQHHPSSALTTQRSTTPLPLPPRPHSPP